jgi:hypothetical protein
VDFSLNCELHLSRDVFHSMFQHRYRPHAD